MYYFGKIFYASKDLPKTISVIYDPLSLRFYQMEIGFW